MGASSKNGAFKDGPEAAAVPLACVVCRERHLKCDGAKPTCSRCIDSRQSCFYVQSRRGHRPSRKRQRSADAGDSNNSKGVAGSYDSPPSATGDERDGVASSTAQDPLDPRAIVRMPYQGPTVPDGIRARIDKAELRDLYYHYFHHAHPILWPQRYLLQMPAAATPPVLDALIDYVGAQYSSAARADKSYLHRLHACLYSKDAKRDGHLVQGLLLLGIVQRAQDHNDLAFASFNEATDLALHLGMNLGAYARLNGGGSFVIEEMWRRTWWELYVNDLMLSAFRHASFSRMHSIDIDVELPWEEVDYRHCVPGVTHTLADFDQNTFFDEDLTFSSFAYRISAARAIGRLLKLNQPYCPESSDLVNSIDVAISNWQLHLPEEKQTALAGDGAIDEMMFQAHLMANAASICLHRPRSNLVFTTVPDATSCTPNRSYGLPASKYSVHTAKCTQAADRIAALITMPGDTLQHTPLYTCMLTLSAVVHLSAYKLSYADDARAGIRDRLALSVGSLKSTRGTWAVADSVLQAIKAAAKEVMIYGARAREHLLAEGVGAGRGGHPIGGDGVSGGSNGVGGFGSGMYSGAAQQMMAGHGGNGHGHGHGHNGNGPGHANNAWMFSFQDPLFAQVPDLLTTEHAMAPLAPAAGGPPTSNQAMAVGLSYA